jgi:hypothetical protein
MARHQPARSEVRLNRSLTVRATACARRLGLPEMLAPMRKFEAITGVDA